MRLIACLLIATIFGGVAHAQDRNNGRSDERGEERRDERREDDRRDGDGRSESELDERLRRDTERRAQYMKWYDPNGDGIIEPSEVPDRGRERFEQRLRAMNADPDEPISVKRYLAERESMERAEATGKDYKPRKYADAGMAFGGSVESEPAPGFDKALSADEQRQLGTSNGSSGSNFDRQLRAVDSKYKNYARGIIDRYDANGNGMLDGSELEKYRYASRYDNNKDGKVTYEELLAGLAGISRSGSSGSSSSRSSSERESDSGESQRRDWRRDRGDSSREESRRTTSDRKSYRFTPAIERLPRGTPSRFIDKDANEDGQVSMHEYATRWSSSTVRSFQSKDLNGDGVITAEEAIKAGF